MSVGFLQLFPLWTWGHQRVLPSAEQLTLISLQTCILPWPPLGFLECSWFPVPYPFLLSHSRVETGLFHPLYWILSLVEIFWALVWKLNESLSNSLSFTVSSAIMKYMHFKNWLCYVKLHNKFHRTHRKVALETTFQIPSAAWKSKNLIKMVKPYVHFH